MRERVCVSAWPLRRERNAQLGERCGLAFEKLRSSFDDVREVDAAEAPGEGARPERTLEHVLQHRTQAECVGAAHEVERRSHERHPNRATLEQRLGERAGLEATEAR